MKIFKLVLSIVCIKYPWLKVPALIAYKNQLPLYQLHKIAWETNEWNKFNKALKEFKQLGGVYESL